MVPSCFSHLSKILSKFRFIKILHLYIAEQAAKIVWVEYISRQWHSLMIYFMSNEIMGNLTLHNILVLNVMFLIIKVSIILNQSFRKIYSYFNPVLLIKYLNSKVGKSFNDLYIFTKNVFITYFDIHFINSNRC